MPKNPDKKPEPCPVPEADTGTPAGHRHVGEGNGSNACPPLPPKGTPEYKHTLNVTVNEFITLIADDHMGPSTPASAPVSLARGIFHIEKTMRKMGIFTDEEIAAVVMNVIAAIAMSGAMMYGAKLGVKPNLIRASTEEAVAIGDFESEVARIKAKAAKAGVEVPAPAKPESK